MRRLSCGARLRRCGGEARPIREGSGSRTPEPRRRQPSDRGCNLVTGRPGLGCRPLRTASRPEAASADGPRITRSVLGEVVQEVRGDPFLHPAEAPGWNPLPPLAADALRSLRSGDPRPAFSAVEARSPSWAGYARRIVIAYRTARPAGGKGEEIRRARIWRDPLRFLIGRAVIREPGAERSGKSGTPRTSG